METGEIRENGHCVYKNLTMQSEWVCDILVMFSEMKQGEEGNMKYKTRLNIAIVIIILFPILLIVMSYGMFGQTQLEQIEKNYGIDMDGHKNWFDTTSVMDKISRKTEQKIQEEIANGVYEEDYLWHAEVFNKSLAGQFSYLVIYDREKYTYIGIPDEKAASILVELPVYGDGDEYDGKTFFQGDKEKYLIYPNRFTHEDGTEGIIYLMAETNRMLPEVKGYLVQFRIMSVLVIILMVLCLGIWAYKCFYAPMRKLKTAMKKVAEGELEFQVEEAYEDEFGGLCRDFEVMRAYLKDALDENIRYDHSTKEMIRNISHDLKTPLTTIKGYAEGILDGVAGTPEKQEKYLRVIYNKAVEMQHMIAELTEYSMIDMKEESFHFISLNVKAYFDDCVEDIRTELESVNFTLAYFNYVDTRVNILADPEKLNRVVSNIIGNSIKYNNKEKGILNIRIKDESDFVHIEIEDNGQGVSPEDASHIFERFYRTDASRNSKTGGSGIGLSIVKEIIEMHGGTVWAVSNPDVGLTIHIMLHKEKEEESKR